MSTLGSTVRLVKADAAGRLRFWSVQCQENSTTVEYGLVRASEAGSTIVKMHATPAAEKQSHRATSEDRLVAIGNAHSAAFKEELEIERYEAQMKAMEVEAALARKAAASQEAAAPAECSTPAPAPLP